MPDVRYMGMHHWTRTIVDDEGKFKKTEIVAPGEVVSVDDDQATRLAGSHIPRQNRLFVMAGSAEDPNASEYEPSRWDRAFTGNYVSPDPALEMGSTVVSGRTITRTADENPEGYELADANEGPASDNELLYERDKIREAGRKAEAEAEEKLATKRSAPSKENKGSGGSSNSGPTSSSGARSGEEK